MGSLMAEGEGWRRQDEIGGRRVVLRHVLERL